MESAILYNGLTAHCEENEHLSSVCFHRLLSLIPPSPPKCLSTVLSFNHNIYVRKGQMRGLFPLGKINAWGMADEWN